MGTLWHACIHPRTFSISFSVALKSICTFHPTPCLSLCLTGWRHTKRLENTGVSYYLETRTARAATSCKPVVCQPAAVWRPPYWRWLLDLVSQRDAHHDNLLTMHNNKCCWCCLYQAQKNWAKVGHFSASNSYTTFTAGKIVSATVKRSRTFQAITIVCYFIPVIIGNKVSIDPPPTPVLIPSPSSPLPVYTQLPTPQQFAIALGLK